MELLRCTIEANECPMCFNSADEAIGYIENNLEKNDFRGGSILVNTSSEGTEFKFENQETLLESLMNL